MTRQALGLVGTALCSIRRRRRVRVRPDGDLWVHEHPSATLYYPEITAVDPDWLQAKTRDNFFWGAAPGPGQLAVDIGAAVGEEALTLSRCVGHSGRVLAVEAHPRTFRCLQRALSANDCGNATAVQAAIAGAAGALRIQDDDAFVGNSVVSGSGDLEVRALTLAQLLDEAGVDGAIHWMKMNIEGAELPALEAAGDVLSRVEHLVVSCHDFKADRTGDEAFRTLEPVRALLEDAGFTIRRRVDDPRPWTRDTLYASR